MRKTSSWIALALALPALAWAAAPWPLLATGQVCEVGGACAPMTVTAQRDGTLAITATVGGLSYSSSGTWEKRRNRVRIQDGSGSVYIGTDAPPCLSGTGTALGRSVTFEVCR